MKKEERVNKILEENAALEAQKGTDVIGEELESIKKKQGLLMLEIRDLDPALYNVIEPTGEVNPEQTTL